MTREALLVTHTRRPGNTAHARTVAADLLDAGFTVRVIAEELPDLDLAGVVPVTGPDAAHGVEIVFALGGDGTFLRAAELARPAKAPLLGVIAVPAHCVRRPIAVVVAGVALAAREHQGA